MNFEDSDPSDLTVEQCEELAAAIAEDASLLPPGPKKDDLLTLSRNYRLLAAMKSMIARKLN